jgi:hypothetical protein
MNFSNKPCQLEIQKTFLISLLLYVYDLENSLAHQSLLRFYIVRSKFIPVINIPVIFTLPRIFKIISLWIICKNISSMLKILLPED